MRMSCVRSFGVDTRLSDHDVTFDPRLAREAQPGVLHRPRAALANEVLALVSPHGTQSREPGDDFHRAVGAFAGSPAADWPEVATCGDRVHDRLAGGRFDFDSDRFNPNTRHGCDRSTEAGEARTQWPLAGSLQRAPFDVAFRCAGRRPCTRMPTTSLHWLAKATGVPSATSTSAQVKLSRKRSPK